MLTDHPALLACWQIGTVTSSVREDGEERGEDGRGRQRSGRSWAGAGHCLCRRLLTGPLAAAPRCQHAGTVAAFPPDIMQCRCHRAPDGRSWEDRFYRRAASNISATMLFKCATVLCTRCRCCPGLPLHLPEQHRCVSSVDQLPSLRPQRGCSPMFPPTMDFHWGFPPFSNGTTCTPGTPECIAKHLELPLADALRTVRGADRASGP